MLTFNRMLSDNNCQYSSWLSFTVDYMYMWNSCDSVITTTISHSQGSLCFN